MKNLLRPLVAATAITLAGCSVQTPYGSLKNSPSAPTQEEIAAQKAATELQNMRRIIIARIQNTMEIEKCDPSLRDYKDLFQTAKTTGFRVQEVVNRDKTTACIAISNALFNTPADCLTVHHSEIVAGIVPRTLPDEVTYRVLVSRGEIAATCPIKPVGTSSLRAKPIPRGMISDVDDLVRKRSR